MMTLLAISSVVLVADQAVKILLPRIIGASAIPLGPFGWVRIVKGRLWVGRLSCVTNPVVTWTLWVASAGALAVATYWMPSSPVFLGFILGGSLSNALENSYRGAVTDYVCLRFWPAFNLSDLSLVVGTIGMTVDLLIRIGEKVY